jgi:hypothetical protein
VYTGTGLQTALLYSFIDSSAKLAKNSVKVTLKNSENTRSLANQMQVSSGFTCFSVFPELYARYFHYFATSSLLLSLRYSIPVYSIVVVTTVLVSFMNIQRLLWWRQVSSAPAN